MFILQTLTALNKDSKFQLFFFLISTFISKSNCHEKIAVKSTQIKLAENVKFFCYMY